MKKLSEQAKVDKAKRWKEIVLQCHLKREVALEAPCCAASF